jgi:peroxiredoxin
MYGAPDFSTYILPERRRPPLPDRPSPLALIFPCLTCHNKGAWQAFPIPAAWGGNQMGNTQTLWVGDIAPDFTLKDHHNREFKLSSFAGRRVLLAFHPLAWTPVCAEQMKALEARKPAFDELQIVAAGISVDSFPTKHAWAKSLGIKETRLLCDFWPHGAVAHAMGVFREEDGFSERANILVDEQGRVAFIKVYDIPQVPDLDEVIASLKK